MTLKIVVAHGESRSIWYVVDEAAPESEQPCVLATCATPREAEQMKAELETKAS